MWAKAPLSLYPAILLCIIHNTCMKSGDWCPHNYQACAAVGRGDKATPVVNGGTANCQKSPGLKRDGAHYAAKAAPNSAAKQCCVVSRCMVLMDSEGLPC